MKYKLAALAATMIVIVGGAGFAATKLDGKSTKSTSSTTAKGGQPVAIVAGAAMAYAYNGQGSGYVIGQLVTCTGTGPDYSCVVILLNQQGQRICGQIDFTLDTAGALALKNGTTLPNARCGG